MPRPGRMRLALLGPHGQLGWALQRALAPLGDVVVLDRTNGGDLADLTRLADSVCAAAPQVIVNAAAYTAVDRAESEPELAHRINAEAPGVLAQAARACGALMVHYSTDYVFDGSGHTPRDETAPTAPLNVYGHTKLAGEQALAASGAHCLVLRTSWVYAARGGNFAKTMLKLAQERDALRVIDDQIGAPTFADWLADATAHAVRATWADPSLAGLYHATASGQTSWHGYAQHVLREAAARGVPLRVQPEAVEPIPSSAYPTPAARPLNSRLDGTRFEQAFQLRRPPWEEGVARLLDALLTGNTP